MNRQVSGCPCGGLVAAIALASVLVFLLPAAVAKAAGSYFSDNFGDNAINFSFWAAIEEGGPTVAEVNGRLEITIPSTSRDPSAIPEQGFRAGYISVAPVSGDFDAQVDFELLTWPSNNGVRVGIIAAQNPYEAPGVQNFNAALERISQTSGESYISDISTHATLKTAPTSDLSGRLRLVRLGDAMSVLYWDSSLDDWAVLHASQGIPTADLYICLWSWSHDYAFGDKDALVAFDDFAVSSSLTAPPTLSGVEPNCGVQGQSLSVTITGANFLGATDVGFGSGVTVNSFTTDNDTQITASITIDILAAAGSRDVSVTNADGTGTLVGDFTVNAALDGQPAQPANLAPSNGAIEIGLTLTLESSAFSDPDEDDTHTASQWQIAASAGDYSSTVFDSGVDNANLTGITIPAGVLNGEMTYYWHVRHLDSQLQWSSWSEETSFTTTAMEHHGNQIALWVQGVLGAGVLLTLGVMAYTVRRRLVKQWQHN
ncbi:MAG: IPT/TIG domain-containing protein [Dehalococcoidia bacterium]|nr:IPT/TIG domain-containing protein [Dehalococcoidia bacterium]